MFRENDENRRRDGQSIERERDAESVEARYKYVCMVGKGRKIDAVIVCCKSNKNVITAMRVVAQLSASILHSFANTHTRTHTHTLTPTHTQRNYLFHTIFNALFYNNNGTE